MSAAPSDIVLPGPAGMSSRPRLVPAPDCEPRPSPSPQDRCPGVPGQTQLRLMVPGPSDLPGSEPSTDRSDPAAFAYQMCQGILDVLAGRRPAQQLMRWLRPDVFDMLRRRASTAPVGTARRVVVRSVRTCRVHDDAVEVAAVAVDGRRARALAMRLDGVGTRWRVTALVIG